ncbi:MAG TPA: hypothetical protein VKX39_01960 [Bryobacteraceae bacterium]|jgi:hypothetical protein|nr:hypothetical protein [Bryobacteraceae bacterium]
MRRLVLTSLFAAAAVFAQSGATPATQSTPAKAPAQKSAAKSVKKHKKSGKKATPPAAAKTAQSK